MGAWLYARRPIMIVIGLCLVMILLTYPLLSSANGAPPYFLIALLSGSFMGQAMFAVVIAGLLGNHWVEAFVAGLGLSCLGIAAFLLSLGLADTWEFVDLTFLAGFALVPGFMFVACLPLYALRLFRQWRFVHEDQFDQQIRDATAGEGDQRRLSIEDLLIATTVVAALFILARLPVVMWEMGSDAMFIWGPILTSGFMLSLAGLSGMPILWISFRIQDEAQRWTWFVLLWLTMTFLPLLVIAALQPRGLADPYTLVAISGFTSAAFVTSIILFSAMKVSGYRLLSRSILRIAAAKQGTGPREEVTELASAVANDAQFDDDSENETVAKSTRRWGPRSAAALVFTIALLASWSVTNLQNYRRTRDHQLNEQARAVAKRGGRIRIENREIKHFVAWPEMTDEELLALDLRDVDMLCLAGTNITDAGVKSLQTNATSLDLSDTGLTDDGLLGLGSYYSNLSLARTKVTIEGLVALQDSTVLYGLNLDDLNLTDKDLGKLELDGIENISLIGNPITDTSLPRLKNIDSVSLGRNRAISDLSKLAFVSNLTLENMEIKNAKQLPSNVNSLKLKASRIPLQVIANMSRLNHLELGDDTYTDTEFSQSGIRQLYSLKLESKQFTAECFAALPMAVTKLSLSGSSVTDESLVHVGKLSGLRSLDLSHTDVSDAAVEVLLRLSAYEVDLTDTRVSAAGIQKLGGRYVVVAADQFTPQEMAKFDRAGVQINDALQY
ncbi:MAG: hypothetical protein R3C53_17495 [Pirellulaceae bacterium]